MIGVDTSIIVRYLVGTPADQAERAQAIVEGDAELGLSVVAIVETAHVLRTQYGVARADVIDTLIELVTRENLTTLELSKPDVLEALVNARTYASSPIPDALISVSARAFGAIPVYTFDERFGRLGAPVAAP